MILFLSDVAGSEIVLILLFILIFFGSKSIPGIARSMGKTIRQIKDASQDLQNEIKKSGAEIKGDLNLSGLIEETARDIQQPIDNYVSDLDESIRYDKSNYFLNKQQEQQTSSRAPLPADQAFLEEPNPSTPNNPTVE